MTPAEQAHEYVARQMTTEQLAGIGPATWVEVVTAHLTPLPSQRLWRIRQRRHSVSLAGQVAQSVAPRLTPPAGARPQPTCEPFCAASHAQGDVA